MKQRKTESQNQTSAVHEIVKQRATKQPEATPEPAPTAPNALVTQDAATPGEMSTVTSVGRLMLFNCQTGAYSTHDDGEEVPKGSEFIAHADSAIHGWIRFDPDGGQVTSIVGGYFDPGWKLPLVNTLPDRDDSAWRVGLSGRPEDPWKQTVSLPLENTKSGAFFTLSGNTPTTVLGLYKFINEYKLLRRRSPDALPVIRLASGTYKSKYGSLVHKPILIIVSRVSGGDIAPPDTSTKALLNDEIPF